MSNPQEPYLDAAIRRIVRYGVRRTTMHDIAAEAGVSRQTLYSVFENKEAVLRAAVRLIADRSLAAIERGCVAPRPIGEQLDILFEQLALAPFRLVHAAPDALDIVEGLTAACADEVQEAGVRYRDAIAAVLAPHATALNSAGLDTASLADFVQTSLFGLKKLARDETHLRSLWATLKTLVLQILRQPA